jgi:cobyrinic acid a,c-diamide synthase
MTPSSAFLIGGTASGSGKTTLTLGIMAALKARGLLVQPYKCGPDFIDPSLHKMVTGEISSNLDLRMCGEQFCRDTFQRRFTGKDVAVVEGVMGLFDGGIASSAALARELSLPVILVVDARSAAESVAAVVKGFEVYSAEVEIGGVIFNRVGTARHRELIENGMAGICSSEILGFFPRDIRFEIPDRHLGLYMGEERPLDNDQLDQLVNAIEKHINLGRLLEISLRPQTAETKSSLVPHKKPEKIRLAVARDKAFCFYYEDNLELLAGSGTELVFFSPLSDRALPTACKGIYFGGGYPELHAAELSSNHKMLKAVREFGLSGGYIYGECGGFMYLCDQLQSIDQQSHKMTGLFPFTVRMKQRLSRLGYRRPKLKGDCFLGEKSQHLHGHEFHYSELVDLPLNVCTLYQVNGETMEGYTSENVIGSYIHLHFARSEENIQLFIKHLEQSNVIT